MSLHDMPLHKRCRYGSTCIPVGDTLKAENGFLWSLLKDSNGDTCGHALGVELHAKRKEGGHRF